MADTDTAPRPAPPVVFKKRTAKPNQRKRPATPPPDDSDSQYSSQDEAGRRIKRRKTKGIAAGSSTASVRPAAAASDDAAADAATGYFAADRSASIAVSSDATKQSSWYEEAAAAAAAAAATDQSARSLLGTSKHAPKSNTQQSAATTTIAAPAKAVGPVKAPTNLRMVTVTDFAPDVCKDYKQTGFCGFGDSCKFLHAREDYKQGWQLDRDWEAAGAAGKKAAAAAKPVEGDDEDAQLEKIPFACVVCKESYKSPVVTKCGHYFCERCALQRYRKTPNCAICGGRTDGSFNAARGLKKLLDKKTERVCKRREEAREAGEAGEDVPEDDVATKAA